MNFDPASDEHTEHIPAMAAVEDTVVEAIVMGSGGARKQRNHRSRVAICAPSAC